MTITKLVLPGKIESEETTKFKRGDKVILNAGGFHMTIESVKARICRVVWHDEVGQCNRDEFTSDMLTLADEYEAPDLEVEVDIDPETVN